MGSDGHSKYGSKVLEPSERTAVENVGNSDHFRQKTPSWQLRPDKLSIFSKLSWAVLAYNLLVVAWGVYVRASKSGDGCGSHWPLCDGGSHPLNGAISRLIEGSHRLTTSLAGLAVLVLLISAVRSFPKGSQVRKAAWAAFGFMAIEGGIGAALVKFQLVTNNASSVRAGVMSFHVVSTFFLMGSITFAAFAGSAGRRITLRRQGALAWMIGLGLLLTAGLGVSGAISALGHQLDPVKDVLKAASLPNTFWMVKLQPMHPYLAIGVGMYLFLTVTVVCYFRPDPFVRRAAAWAMGAYGVELLVGLMNIKTMAPIGLQMIHLASADALVVTLVWFSLRALQVGIPRREAMAGQAPEEGPVAEAVHGMALVKAWIALTKPRVISLLLFTTVAAMFAAAGGWPGAGKLVFVMIGGYLAAGAANAFNMAIERDLDQAMKRTRSRPIVSDRLSTQGALRFAFIAFVASFSILWASANLLTAIMAESGLVFYVSIYTLGLKRRTWQNIVIGGAAGAFPPLVGWAAVNGSLGLMAWCLFGIVFLWTPMHFWALAILLKDDYAEAGVPMLPVVKGIQVTVNQICFYTALTVLASITPYLARWSNWPYFLAVSALNVWLVLLCFRLFKRPERAQASNLFHYSMIYLALLFVAFAADRALDPPSTRVESPTVAAIEAQQNDGGPGHGRVGEINAVFDDEGLAFFGVGSQRTESI